VQANFGIGKLAKVNAYFLRWDHDGTLDRIHHALYVQCRKKAGREASPAAAIMNARFIPHLLFKYLKTLRFDFRIRPDTGGLFA
jgi:hypothetical protein